MPDTAVAVLLAEPLLTAAEVARLLRVPRSSVYEYARRRDEPLPSVAIGRHRRYYRGDVEEWLARRRVSRPMG
jgi:excisionase family DNA binding protein